MLNPILAKRKAVAEVWPKGSMCQPTRGWTVVRPNWAWSQRCPIVIWSTWSTKCEAASSDMHHPALMNSSWPRSTIARTSLRQVAFCSFHQSWKKATST